MTGPVPFNPMSLIQVAPTLWSVSYGKGPDGVTSMVMVQIATPTGAHVDLLEVDAAEEIGMDIVNAARRARSGIILPDGVNGTDLHGPPPGHPG